MTLSPTARRAALVAAAATLPAVLLAAATLSPASASPRHDGAWNIQLVTEQGWCGAHQWRIGVRGGRITDVGAPGAVANGRIDPNGRVSLQIAKGADVIQSSGVINEKAGGGAWVLPNRSCTGRWVASKA